MRNFSKKVNALHLPRLLRGNVLVWANRKPYPDVAVKPYREQSFFDLKNNQIQIGFFEKERVLSPKRLYIASMAKLAHEVAHFNYTNGESYLRHLEDLRNLGNYHFQQVWRFVFNSVEDGRIEFFQAQKGETVRNYLRFLNYLMFLENLTEGEEMDDGRIIQSTILTYAKLGLVPEYLSVKSEVGKLLLEEICPLIDEIVVEPSYEEAYDKMSLICEKLYEFFKANDDDDSGQGEEENDSQGEDQDQDQDQDQGKGQGQGSDNALSQDELDEILESLVDSIKESGFGDSYHYDVENYEGEDYQGEADAGKSVRKSNEEKNQGQGEDQGDDQDEGSDQGEGGDQSNGDNHSQDGDQDHSQGESHKEKGTRGISQKDQIQNSLEEIERTEAESVNADVCKKIEIDNARWDRAYREAVARAEKHFFDKENGIVNLRRENIALIEHGLPQEIKLRSKKLEAEFDQILANKVVHSQKFQQKGILDTSALYGLVAGINNNVFETAGSLQERSFAIKVLVDSSGSMNGEKFREAIETCAILEEALRGKVALSISYYSAVYGNGGIENIDTLLLDYDDEIPFNVTWSGYKEEEISPDYGNAEYVNLRLEIERLRNRPETDKIIFLLSDGLPCRCFSTNKSPEDIMKEVADQAKREVVLLPIFFGSEDERANNIGSYKKMYGDLIVSTSPQDICKSVSNLLKQMLQR